jgi:hypothetical protein
MFQRKKQHTAARPNNDWKPLLGLGYKELIMRRGK